MISRFCLGAVLLLMFSSCRVQRFVPETEMLYGGSSLVIKTDSGVNEPKVLQQELEDLFKPDPNTRFLWQRTPLWLYYRAQRPETKRLGRYLNRKFGEKPVYASDIDIERTKTLLTNRLKIGGFLIIKSSRRVRLKTKNYSSVMRSRSKVPTALKRTPISATVACLIKYYAMAC